MKINTTLCKWLGFEENEEIEVDTIEDLLNMGGKIYFQTHVLPSLQMQGKIAEINLMMVGRNSTTFPALINAKQDALEAAKMQTFSLFVLDITQRNSYEKELLKERKKAEDATKRMKQVNSDLEQFAYTASHDLQSPLRTISGLISLLEKKKKIEPDSEEEKLFSLIKSNSKQMRMMIGDLLEYAKVENNQNDFASVSIQEVCNQAINLLLNAIEESGAVFHISEMPSIFGSKPQLVRLFQNLFENAIKYRSKANPIIEVTYTKTIDCHCIKVSDNGIGFDMADAAEIFTFKKRLYTGNDIPETGIGLTACKRIIQNHHGSISASSEPGKGAIFNLEFPVL